MHMPGAGAGGREQDKGRNRTHNSLTNFGLNIVRTMSVITWGSSAVSMWHKAQASKGRQRDLAGLLWRDLLGDQTLLQDVHHLSAEVDHSQGHAQQRHPRPSRA